MLHISHCRLSQARNFFIKKSEKKSPKHKQKYYDVKHAEHVYEETREYQLHDSNKHWYK